MHALVRDSLTMLRPPTYDVMTADLRCYDRLLTMLRPPRSIPDRKTRVEIKRRHKVKKLRIGTNNKALSESVSTSMMPLRFFSLIIEKNSGVYVEVQQTQK